MAKTQEDGFRRSLLEDGPGSLYCRSFRHDCQWRGDTQDLPTAGTEARLLNEVNTKLPAGYKVAYSLYMRYCTV